MIDNATIVVHPATGGVLVLLPHTGMDIKAETTVSLDDGQIVVSQDGRRYVEAALASASDADLLLGNEDLTVAEVDEDGIKIHDNVRGPTP